MLGFIIFVRALNLAAAFNPVSLKMGTVVNNPSCADLPVAVLAGQIRLARCGHIISINDDLTVLANKRSKQHTSQIGADASVARTLRVTADIPSGTRLTVALTLIAPDAFGSLSSARKWVRRRLVLLNDAIAASTSTVAPGDQIVLQAQVDEGQQPPTGVQPFPLDIVYEDAHLAVVFKPEGVMTHETSKLMRLLSLDRCVKYALTPPPPGTPDAITPAPVHRLDRATSGLVLVAKTKPASRSLSQMFASRNITKRYCALVAGKVPQEEGWIDSPVDGKGARTRYAVASRHRSLHLGDGHLTMLHLWPVTGRKHQLRRHCAEILGCPIVGDTKYGWHKSRATSDNMAHGVYLAAVALTLPHPCQTSQDRAGADSHGV